jgi:hypothetical protein
MRPYAARVHESNQGSEDEGTLAPVVGEPSGAAPSVAIGRDLPPVLPGLWTWFTIIFALGLVGVVWKQAEMALSVALAGAFVAAHAADRDPGLSSLHRLLTGVFVAGGALVFALIAFWLAGQSTGGALRPVAIGIAGGGAVLCLVSVLRPVSDALAEVLFRAEPTHALRLAARLVMMVMLFALPGWAAFPGVLESFGESGRPLLDVPQLVGSVVGLSVLALGAVGFLIRRDARATLERLGLRALRPSHLAVMVLGVVALYGLNAGTEAFQHRWLPEMWRHDQRISQLIVGGLGLGGSLLLGLSAGVGEELAMRGALQPRLGLVLTSLTFAVLHVQYSWFGMATIFMLGVLLGVIRNRTSTTVAIMVHTLYDIAAVFATRGGGQ